MRALVVITAEEEISTLMGWARWLEDKGDGEDVEVLCALLAKQEQDIQSHKLGDSHDHPLIHRVIELAAEIDKGVDVKSYRGSRFIDIIRKLILKDGVDLVVISNTETARARFGEESSLAAVLVSEAHCDVMVVDVARPPKSSKNILVPVTEDPHAERALQIGRELADRYDGTVTALYVGESDPDDAAAWAQRRLSRVLEKTGLSQSRVIISDARVADQPLMEICEVLPGDYDIILISADHTELLEKRGGVSSRLLDAAPNAAVATLRSETPLVEKTRRFLNSWLQKFLPHLTRDARLDLFDHLKQGSQVGIDFIMLMGLATAIASLGLLQNSGAVVIGAMLVAPLMTPMIGAGLGLVQGNQVLVQTASRSILVGFLLALAVGFFFGITTPTMPDLNAQLLGRTNPNLLDLWIALFSGVAAAYALARPGLVAALPGVAIAAALVPPIATVGICLAAGQLTSAAGAALLFATNLVAIIIASGATLYLMGIRANHNQTGTRLFVKRIWTALLVSIMVLSIPLVIALLSNFGEDEVLLSASIESMLEEHSGVELDTIDIEKKDGEMHVMVRLFSTADVSQDLVDALGAKVQGRFDESCSVRVVTLLSHVPR